MHSGEPSIRIKPQNEKTIILSFHHTQNQRLVLKSKIKEGEMGERIEYLW